VRVSVRISPGSTVIAWGSQAAATSQGGGGGGGGGGGSQHAGPRRVHPEATTQAASLTLTPTLTLTLSLSLSLALTRRLLRASRGGAFGRGGGRQLS